MNREIKFRAWDPDDKEMYFPEVLELINTKPLRKCKDGNRAYKDHILMQFTGLKDKNGVEIYEGDILQRINGEVRTNNKWVPNREISIVVWEDAAFALKSSGSEAVDWAHSSYYQDTEVIGNIHKNQEFLKTKS